MSNTLRSCIAVLALFILSGCYNYKANIIPDDGAPKGYKSLENQEKGKIFKYHNALEGKLEGVFDVEKCDSKLAFQLYHIPRGKDKETMISSLKCIEEESENTNDVYIYNVARDEGEDGIKPFFIRGKYYCKDRKTKNKACLWNEKIDKRFPLSVRIVSSKKEKVSALGYSDVFLNGSRIFFEEVSIKEREGVYMYEIPGRHLVRKYMPHDAPLSVRFTSVKNESYELVEEGSIQLGQVLSGSFNSYFDDVDDPEIKCIKTYLERTIEGTKANPKRQTELDAQWSDSCQATEFAKSLQGNSCDEEEEHDNMVKRMSCMSLASLNSYKEKLSVAKNRVNSLPVKLPSDPELLIAYYESNVQTLDEPTKTAIDEYIGHYRKLQELKNWLERVDEVVVAILQNNTVVTQSIVEAVRSDEEKLRLYMSFTEQFEDQDAFFSSKKNNPPITSEIGAFVDMEFKDPVQYFYFVTWNAIPFGIGSAYVDAIDLSTALPIVDLAGVRFLFQDNFLEGSRIGDVRFAMGVGLYNEQLKFELEDRTVEETYINPHFNVSAGLGSFRAGVGVGRSPYGALDDEIMNQLDDDRKTELFGSQPLSYVKFFVGIDLLKLIINESSGYDESPEGSQGSK